MANESNESDERPWRRNDDRDTANRTNDREPRYDDRGSYQERPHYEEPHRGGLILALGIMGIAVCGICGIFAWFMGTTDIRKMDAGQMNPEGRGLTQAGKIMGLISMIIMVLSVIAMIGMFGLMFFVGVAAPPAAPAPAPAIKVNNQIQPAPFQAPKR
jgi:flagellar basal body-associated protein FliL